ncbi:hypothetical protein RhiirA1_461924 [Rhizophagus irregularis]|uniref:F-box domain-containing protein n=1 Tax=Rhizophagus irregularis TaxID=588596 RepID=A0A2N0RNC1_9GLOM|nr:hypothetical protein RhiirA1_461924 [Rhizophagus irregularis]
MPQLLADCLDEVIEYLNDDKYSLHSCSLVNRLWCKVTVGILWRDCNNYNGESDSSYDENNSYSDDDERCDL